MSRSTPVLVSAVVVLAAFCPAARADVIATERAPTSIAASHGVAVWSSHESSSPLSDYRLRLFANGVVRTVPIRSQSVRFDANIGVDSRGRTVVVYSRCRKASQNRVDAEGCSLFEYVLRTRKVRRLPVRVPRASSNFLPAVDGDYVAFASVGDNAARPMPRIYLFNGKRNRLSRLAAGARGGYQLRSDGFYNGPTPSALALKSGRVALLWTHFDPACADDVGEYRPTTEVILTTRTSGAKSVASATCEEQNGLGGLALTDSSVLFLRHDGTDRALWSYRFTTGNRLSASGYREADSVAGSENDLFDVRYVPEQAVWTVTRSRPTFSAP